MQNLNDFFENHNIEKDISKLNVEETNDYLEPMKAIARLSYASVYVIDYLKQSFDYVSENPLFLCGLSPEKVKSMGYEFYFKNVPPEDVDLLFKINDAGFEFYDNVPIPDLKKYSMTYDFTLLSKDKKKLLINHKITPLFISNEGKLWKTLCLVSLSNNRNSGNIKVFKHDENLEFNYDLKTLTWSKSPKVVLSEREIEILQLSSGGFNINEIADKLFISPDTVKFHRRKLFEKLEVNNISEALIKAMNNKLI